MKIIKSEFLGNEPVLHLYGMLGIGPGKYLDEHWLIPVDDNAEQMGFLITDIINDDPPTERAWIKTMVNSTISASETEEDAVSYLKWHFKSLIESVMFKYHVTVDMNLYSEILLYEEIDRFVNYIINSSKYHEEDEPEPEDNPEE